MLACVMRKPVLLPAHCFHGILLSRSLVLCLQAGRSLGRCLALLAPFAAASNLPTKMQEISQLSLELSAACKAGQTSRLSYGVEPRILGKQQQQEQGDGLTAAPHSKLQAVQKDGQRSVSMPGGPISSAAGSELLQSPIRWLSDVAIVSADERAAAEASEPLGYAAAKGSKGVSNTSKLHRQALAAGVSEGAAASGLPQQQTRAQQQQQQLPDDDSWEQQEQLSLGSADVVQVEGETVAVSGSSSAASVADGAGPDCLEQGFRDAAGVSCSTRVLSNTDGSCVTTKQIQSASTAFSPELATTGGGGSAIPQLDLEVSQVFSGSEQDWYAPASSKASPSAVTSYDNPLAANDATEGDEPEQQQEQADTTVGSLPDNQAKAGGDWDWEDEAEVSPTAVDPPRRSYMAHGAAALEAEVPESAEQMAVVEARSRDITFGGAALAEGEAGARDVEGAGLSGVVVTADKAGDSFLQVHGHAVVSAAEGAGVAAAAAMDLAAAAEEAAVVATAAMAVAAAASSSSTAAAASPQRPYGVLGTPRATPEGFAWQQVRRSSQVFRPGAFCEVSGR